MWVCVWGECGFDLSVDLCVCGFVCVGCGFECVECEFVWMGSVDLSVWSVDLCV